MRRRRQAVEHRLARLMQLGLRQARYVGRTKTLFQVAMAAAVANLTLLAGLDLARMAGSGLSDTSGAAPVAPAALVALIATAWAVWAAMAVPPACGRIWPHSLHRAAVCRPPLSQ